MADALAIERVAADLAVFHPGQFFRLTLGARAAPVGLAALSYIPLTTRLREHCEHIRPLRVFHYETPECSDYFCPRATEALLEGPFVVRAEQCVFREGGGVAEFARDLPPIGQEFVVIRALEAHRVKTRRFQCVVPLWKIIPADVVPGEFRRDAEFFPRDCLSAAGFHCRADGGEELFAIRLRWFFGLLGLFGALHVPRP